MVARNQQNIRTRVQAVPYAFVNSTIAILMACAGFVVHDLLVSRGSFGPYTSISSFWILTNIAIIYLWPKFAELKWSRHLLFTLMGLQWVGIIYAVVGFYTNRFAFELITTALVLLFIGVTSKHRLDKWAGTAVFSVLGTVAMGGSIWQGLEDWTMSAAARAGNSEQRIVPKVTLPTWLKRAGQKAPPTHERSAAGQTWAYAGEAGPAMWGKLNTTFAQCSDGVNQSPVDIPRHSPIKQNPFKARWTEDHGQVSADGRALEVALSAKNQIELDGRNYSLKRMAFHTPSEHQLNGLTFPMEVQYFLEGKSGELAAISTFVEIGQSNSEFGKILAVLPSAEAPRGQKIEKLEPDKMLPGELAAYRYMGSYTSPPCTEGVRWSVMSQSIEFSSEQVAAFRRLVRFNARPVQPLGVRTLESSPAAIAH